MILITEEMKIEAIRSLKDKYTEAEIKELIDDNITREKISTENGEALKLELFPIEA